MARTDPAAQRQQLTQQRHQVDFDSYDITVDELVRRVGMNRIEIAPAYQRKFRWDLERQGRLIESLLLGIPVPSLFMATNVDEDRGVTWEVVDGLQRLLTLVGFVGDEKVREVARLDGAPTRLAGLEKLKHLEGETAATLPTDILTGLLDRPIKVIVLNDKSNLKVRFDLFERLNTGGIRLTDQELRGSVFMGPFIDLLDTLSQDADFNSVVTLPRAQQQDGSAQEYILRFFAFYDRYREFDHSVRDFLNDYCATGAEDPQVTERTALFKETFSFLARCFPEGLKTRKGTTPVNLFEGVTVGARLALDVNPELAAPQSLDWVHSAEMKSVTTGATNNRSRVTGRVEKSRDHFIAGQ
jgi:hypothetical protein